MPELKRLTDEFVQLRGALGDFLSTTVNDDRFDALLRAAVAKSLDFNVRVQSAAEADGILHQPFLRGLVEDLIFFRFLEGVPRDDRERLLDLLGAHDTYRFVEKQRAFFEKRRPHQPIYLTELHGKNAATEEKKVQAELKAHCMKMAINCRANGPIVRDLAERAGLEALYDYLYAATSRTVHFTPGALWRLGWCTIPGKDPEALDGTERYSFSLSHFARYHSTFTRFYAAYLFLELAHPVLAQLDDAEVSSATSVIRGVLDEVDRWPEVITFEEMNVSLKDGIHFFRFTKAPLATIMLKGLPKHIRGRSEAYGAQGDDDEPDPRRD